MSIAKLELELRTSLMETGLVQPVKGSSKSGHIEVICRQVPGQEQPWIMVMTNLLLASEEEGVDLHVCRRYVLKERKLVFGWHVELNAKNLPGLKTAVSLMCAELAEAKPVLDAPAPVQKASPRNPPRYNSPYSTDAQAAVKAGLVEKDAEAGFMGKVNAEPRLDLSLASGDSDPDSPSLRVVSRNRTSKGENYEMEMPLPHIRGEMNVPKHPNGRGAKKMGES